MGQDWSKYDETTKFMITGDIVLIIAAFFISIAVGMGFQKTDYSEFAIGLIFGCAAFIIISIIFLTNFALNYSLINSDNVIPFGLYGIDFLLLICVIYFRYTLGTCIDETPVADSKPADPKPASFGKRRYRFGAVTRKCSDNKFFRNYKNIVRLNDIFLMLFIGALIFTAMYLKYQYYICAKNCPEEKK